MVRSLTQSGQDVDQTSTVDDVVSGPVDAAAQQAAAAVTGRRITDDDPAAKIVETVKSTFPAGESDQTSSHADLMSLTLTKGPEHPETLEKLKWLLDFLPGVGGVLELKEAFTGKTHGHKLGVLRRIKEGLTGLARILLDIHTLGVGGRLLALLARIASAAHKAEDAAFAVQWSPLLKELTHSGFSDASMKKFLELSQQPSLVEKAQGDIEKLFAKHEQAAETGASSDTSASGAVATAAPAVDSQ
jgi:hypothetical protein